MTPSPLRILLTLLFLSSMLQAEPQPVTAVQQVKFEVEAKDSSVTVRDYCEFLNAAAVLDLYGLYDEKMDSIKRSGTSGYYSFAVTPGAEEKPITYINDLSAKYYVNWLESVASTSTNNFNYCEVAGSCFAACDEQLRSNLFNFCNIIAGGGMTEKNVGGEATFGGRLLASIAFLFMGEEGVRRAQPEELHRSGEVVQAAAPGAVRYQEADQRLQDHHQHLQNREATLQQAHQFLKEAPTNPQETPSEKLSRYAKKFSELLTSDPQRQEAAMETEKLARHEASNQILCLAREAKKNPANTPAQAIDLLRQRVTAAQEKLQQLQHPTSSEMQQLMALPENFAAAYEQAFTKQGTLRKKGDVNTPMTTALGDLQDCITASRNIERAQARLDAEETALHMLEAEDVEGGRSTIAASLASVVRNKFFVPGLLLTGYLIKRGLEPVALPEKAALAAVNSSSLVLPTTFVLPAEKIVQAKEKNSTALISWEQYPWSPEIPDQWGPLSNGVSTDEIINQQIMISGTDPLALEADPLAQTYPSLGKIPAYLAWENAGELRNKRNQCPGEAFFNNAKTEFSGTLAVPQNLPLEPERIVLAEKNATAFVHWTHYPWNYDGNIYGGTRTSIMDLQPWSDGRVPLFEASTYNAWSPREQKSPSSDAFGFCNVSDIFLRKLKVPKKLVVEKETVLENSSQESYEEGSQSQYESAKGPYLKTSAAIGLTTVAAAWAVKKYLEPAKFITKKTTKEDPLTPRPTTVKSTTIITTDRENMVEGANPAVFGAETPRRPTALIQRDLTDEMNRAVLQHTTPPDNGDGNIHDTWRNTGGTDEDHSDDDFEDASEEG